MESRDLLGGVTADLCFQSHLLRLCTDRGVDKVDFVFTVSRVVSLGVTLSIQWSESIMYKATYVMPASGMSVNMKTGETNKAGEELDANAEMERFYGIVRAVGMPLPKTRDATYLLRKKTSY